MDETIKLLQEEEKEANDRLKSVTLKEYKSMNKEQSLIEGVLSKFEAITDYLKGYKPPQVEFPAQMEVTVVSKSGDYTASSSDSIIVVTASCTITLPTASSNTNRMLIIKNDISTAGAVTIAAGDNIDGAASKSLATRYSTATVFCNGTTWFIVSYYIGGAL